MSQRSASLRFTLALPIVLLLFIVQPGYGKPAGVVPFVVTAATGATLSVNVSGSQVTARGVTPNGEVVVFGRTHRHVGGTPHLGRHASVERDTDGDGVVSLTIAELPPHSVWVVVDQQTGSQAAGAPDGQELRVFPLATGAWYEGAESIDIRSGFLDFLLVRPGKGAWLLDITQGGRNDDDGRLDAVLRARLGTLEQLAGKEKAPTHAQKKDVLAIIDPRTLDVFVKAAE